MIAWILMRGEFDHAMPQIACPIKSYGQMHNLDPEMP